LKIHDESLTKRIEHVNSFRQKHTSWASQFTAIPLTTELLELRETEMLETTAEIVICFRRRFQVWHRELQRSPKTLQVAHTKIHHELDILHRKT